MIYDISKYSLKDFLENERLISEILGSNPTLVVDEAKEKIQFAYEKCVGFRKPEPVKSSDHQPCIECGGIEFMRTGTCFACITCGSSQGCS